MLLKQKQYLFIEINFSILRFFKIKAKSGILYLIFLFFLFFSTTVHSQIPQKVFEITNILVDGCAGGGSDEGPNEMVLFQIGPTPVNVNNLRVDGALGNGIIVQNKWPNTANSWKGIAAPPAKPAEIAQINSTITNCGFLIEPAGGILPAGKLVLLITSTDFNPTAHSFASLNDTLYVIFQNSGNTAGHFANFGTPSSPRTFVLMNTATSVGDTVIYDRSLLIDQQGQPVAQDGAAVSFEWNGTPFYYNNGCQALYNPTDASWANPGNICENDNIIDLNTLITGTPGGSWSGNGVSDHFFNPLGLSGDIIITYSLGTQSCLVTESHTITVHLKPVANPSSNSPICEGNDLILQTDFIIGSDYNWSGPNGFQSNLQNPVIANASSTNAGTYTLTLSNAFCSSDFSTTSVIINSYPLANATSNSPLCVGSNIELSVNYIDGASYLWSGPNGFNNSSQNPVISNAQMVDAGTYIVTVTLNNCQTTSSVNVVLQSNFNATITTSQLNYCIEDASVQFTSSLSGGIWSGNGITPSGLFSPSIAGTGTHTITYTISGQCGGTNSVDVTVHPNPVVNLGQDQSVCLGNTVQLDAGSGFASYSWNPSYNGQIFQVTQTGIYSVTVTNSFNCKSSDEVDITFTSQADATITTSQTTFCLNDTPIQFTSQDSGGLWSGNGISSSGLFSPSIAGTGTHSITYTISGLCGGTNSVDVTVHPNPIVNLGQDQSICLGNTVQLDAGTGFDTYSWTPSYSGQIFQVTETGNYSVTVTNSFNCQSSDEVTITFIPQADATITTTQTTFCLNDTPIQFTSQNSGGLWSGIGITSSGLFSPSIAGTGTHLITYSFSGTCGDSKTLEITVYPNPIVNLGQDQSLCVGSIVQLDAGTGFDTYSWTPSYSGQIFQVTETGNYSVTVTNSFNCQSSDEVTITFIPQADATITTTQTTFCLNDTPIQFTSVNSGGLWTGNGITTTGYFNPLLAGEGIHTITYTISGQCGDAKTKDITVYQLPAYTINSTNETCINAANGTVHIIPEDQNATILWNNQQTSFELNDLQEGQYSFIISDMHCSVNGYITIAAGLSDCNPPHVWVPNVFSPDKNGENDFFYIRGSGIETFEFRIFNRWGEQIFYSDNQNTFWDGTFKGKDVEIGVYAYTLKVIFTNRITKELYGSITLIR